MSHPSNRVIVSKGLRILHAYSSQETQVADLLKAKAECYALSQDYRARGNTKEAFKFETLARTLEVMTEPEWFKFYVEANNAELLRLAQEKREFIAQGRWTFWLQNYDALMRLADEWGWKLRCKENNISSQEEYAMILCDNALGAMFTHSRRINNQPLEAS